MANFTPTVLVADAQFIKANGGGGAYDFNSQVPNNIAFLHQWNGAAVHGNSNQSITFNTATKVVLDTVPTEGDPRSWFDEATNYRFLPSIADTFLIQASVTFDASAASRARVMIYKNGSEVKRAVSVLHAAVETTLTVFLPVVFNGTSDYVEIFVFHEVSPGPVNLLGGSIWNGFLAHRIGD